MKIKNVIFYISFLLISSIVSLTPLLANEDAKGVVKERMANFKMSKKMMQTIHKSIQNEDFVTIEKSATTLHNWSKEMIKYFPEGSGGGVSDASAKIWKDFDGFKEAAKKFELAALSVVEVANLSDKDAIMAAASTVGDSCKSCHRKFKH